MPGAGIKPKYAWSDTKHTPPPLGVCPLTSYCRPWHSLWRRNTACAGQDYNGKFYSLGGADSNPAGWSVDPEDNSVSINYQGGDTPSCKNPRQANVKLACDSTAIDPTVVALTFVNENPQCARCAFFDRDLHARSAIEFHAFAPLEALPCVCPMTFISGVHSSYRLALDRPNTKGLQSDRNWALRLSGEVRPTLSTLSTTITAQPTSIPTITIPAPTPTPIPTSTTTSTA
jgi:hypothetical protein